MFYFLTYPIFFVIFRLLARTLGRLRSSGEANVPRKGAFLYCPNHTTDIDPAILMVTIPRRCWYIAKEELFDIPVLGWLLAHYQTFPIKRNSADRAALRRAEHLLRAGEPLTIFAEGRGSPDGRLQRLQPGAAMLAVRAGVPLVPVGIQYANEFVPYGTMTPRWSRHPITVTFGPPIRPEDYAHLRHGRRIEAMTKKLGEEIARLTNQSPPPEPPTIKHGTQTAPDDAAPCP